MPHTAEASPFLSNAAEASAQFRFPGCRNAKTTIWLSRACAASSARIMTSCDWPERSDLMVMNKADEVLRFWFDELSRAQWFSVTQELDAEIRDRFGELHLAFA